MSHASDMGGAIDGAPGCVAIAYQYAAIITEEFLRVSQPALSAQLNRLRDLFEDPLLVPAHRGMIPTAKVLELLEPLRASLDQFRKMLQSHDRFAPETAELKVAIACTDYVEASVVMPLILALRERAPKIRVAVHRLNPPTLPRQLAEGDVDFAIATPDPLNQDLRTQHLFEENYVLIGREGHSRIKDAATVEGFAGLEQVIVSPSGGSFSTPVDALLAAQGCQRRVAASAASFLVVPGMVASSDLVALVPRRLLRTAGPPLDVMEVPWLSESFEVAMIWHERGQGHQGHRWVRELVHGLTAG
ncbi:MULTISPECIES: LysR substrate-binding domain-containing protein [Rhizobium/Agrobacterium group]|uniref:LysR substrate-binding domain-containing protein n=2 Tax=Rhizobium/Agrobacterium group TaxID=227290 RepID=UPI0015DC38DB|nr:MULTISPECIES: LysR substrate-binding domain-containing protein [Rhizobium/Agrobacterium group]BCH67950.1 transcriptional regulator [Agrobacterium vitis]